MEELETKLPSAGADESTHTNHDIENKEKMNIASVPLIVQPEPKCFDTNTCPNLNDVVAVDRPIGVCPW